MVTPLSIGDDVIFGWWWYCCYFVILVGHIHILGTPLAKHASMKRAGTYSKTSLHELVLSMEGSVANGAPLCKRFGCHSKYACRTKSKFFFWEECFFSGLRWALLALLGLARCVSCICQLSRPYIWWYFFLLLSPVASLVGCFPHSPVDWDLNAPKSTWQITGVQALVVHHHFQMNSKDILSSTLLQRAAGV